MTQKTSDSGKERLAMILSIVLLTVFFLFLKNAVLVTSAMRAGLEDCFSHLIPSLFPFAVLASLLRSTGAVSTALRPVAEPLSRLLGVPEPALTPIFLGLLGGFPIGIVGLLALFDEGKLSKKETERLLGVCSVPGPAFLIGTVGEGYLKNAHAGAVFWVLLLFFSLIFCRLTRPKHPSPSCHPRESSISLSPALLPGAFLSGARACLPVVSGVLFFTVITEAAKAICRRFSLPPLSGALFSSLLELTAGVRAATALEGGFLSCLLLGATLGWSGLCVSCQALAFIGDRPISPALWFASRLFLSLTVGISGACLSLL